jgi:hypothetical protein
MENICSNKDGNRVLAKGLCSKCYWAKDNGMHNRTRTPERVSWDCMVQRCTNTNNPNWNNYGGRGVTVSDELRTFEGFLKVLGKKPDPTYTVDRINPFLGYEKGNVRWATRKEQANNRRSNYKHA